MIFIYCDKVSPRLSYTTSIVFDLIYSMPSTLTQNLDEFSAYNGPKFSYSERQINDIPWIQNSGLLKETNISNDKPRHAEHQGLTHLFPNNGSILPYDVFSSVFFIISRYEEYQDYTPDQYDRFPLEESISHQLGFYKKAIIHHWCEQLAQALNSLFPELIKDSKTFSAEIGLDIDNAFAIKHKGLIRTAGGLFKSLFKTKDFAMRISVLLGRKTDPYDNYNFIKDSLTQHSVKLKVFFLSGKYGVNDKNISPRSHVFKTLVKEFMNYGEVGIHPSYASNENDTLKDEIKTLEIISGKKIAISRQHYLKLKMPKTYRKLTDSGIKHDYSMGFSEDSGFRAGMALPYPFFDLLENKTSGLMIHPFFFMEATYVHYRNFNFNKVKSEMLELIDEVKSVKGVFHSVWHNEYFGGEDGDKWKDLFLIMLKKSQNK